MSAHEKLLQEQVEMLVMECNQHRDTIQSLLQKVADARVECGMWKGKYEALSAHVAERNEMTYAKNTAM